MKVAVVEFNSSGGLIHYAYQLCCALTDAHADVVLITGIHYELENFPHPFRVWNHLNVWPVFDPEVMQTVSGRPWGRQWRKLKRMVRRGARAVKLVRAWIRLVADLDRLKPDIVQFGEIKFAFEAFFLNWLSRKGFVLTQICHEFEPRERLRRGSILMDRAYRHVFKNFSAMFFHARQNRDRFLQLYAFPEKNIHIIPHGNENMFLSEASRLEPVEDLRDRYGLARGERVVLFFGMLTPSKGIGDLIVAFRAVRDRVRAKLVIAGYPSKYIHMDDLRKQVADGDLCEDVIFDTRYIPIGTIGNLMTLADVVAFPYHNATQSGSLQLAYAFGRPVVATRVGGLPEAVADGRTGYLVPPHEPEKLAEKIISILVSPQVAEEMGHAARRFAEIHFGWESIARRITDVYAGLLDQRRRVSVQ